MGHLKQNFNIMLNNSFKNLTHTVYFNNFTKQLLWVKYYVLYLHSAEQTAKRDLKWMPSVHFGTVQLAPKQLISGVLPLTGAFLLR
jgi:hypothetical protein